MTGWANAVLEKEKASENRDVFRFIMNSSVESKSGVEPKQGKGVHLSPDTRVKPAAKVATLSKTVSLPSLGRLELTKDLPCFALRGVNALV
ncbi:hypothetical protein D6V20_06175 [Vibrio cholerae]|nr:hypothetical protein [Vibrio cholerae]